MSASRVLHSNFPAAVFRIHYFDFFSSSGNSSFIANCLFCVTPFEVVHKVLNKRHFSF